MAVAGTDTTEEPMTKMPLMDGYYTASRRRSPPLSAGPVVSRTARLLLCKLLHHPAGCPGSVGVV